MRIIPTSQVSSKREVRTTPGSDGKLHKAVIKVLDEMSETAKRISDKRKPYIPGKPSGRLIPDYPIRCMDVTASSEATAMFFEEDDASESFWVVSRSGERVKLTLQELFPSGEYDISQVRSDGFGESLEVRMSGKPLIEAKKELLAENESSVGVSSPVTLVSEIGEETKNDAVCNWIPLNDFEKDLSDLLRMSVEPPSQREM